MPIRPEDLSESQTAILETADQRVDEVSVQIAQLLMDLPDVQRDLSSYDFVLGQNVGELLAPDSVSGMVARRVSRKLIDMLGHDGPVDPEIRGIISFTAAITAREIDRMTDAIQEADQE